MWGVCVHAHLQRSDEGTNLLELQLQAVVSCSTQVPETRFTGRAAGTLNC